MEQWKKNATDNLLADELLQLAIRKGVDAEKLLLAGMNADTTEQYFIRCYNRGGTEPKKTTIRQLYLVEYPGRSLFGNQIIDKHALMFWNSVKRVFQSESIVIPAWNWWFKV